MHMVVADSPTVKQKLTSRVWHQSLVDREWARLVEAHDVGTRCADAPQRRVAPRRDLLRRCVRKDPAGAPEQVVRRDGRRDEFDDLCLVTGRLESAGSFRIYPGLYEPAANRSLVWNMKAACLRNGAG